MIRGIISSEERREVNRAAGKSVEFLL